MCLISNVVPLMLLFWKVCFIVVIKSHCIWVKTLQMKFSIYPRKFKFLWKFCINICSSFGWKFVVLALIESQFWHHWRNRGSMREASRSARSVVMALAPQSTGISSWLVMYVDSPCAGHAMSTRGRTGTSPARSARLSTRGIKVWSWIFVIFVE